jgi:hypothetical protein
MRGVQSINNVNGIAARPQAPPVGLTFNLRISA